MKGSIPFLFILLFASLVFAADFVPQGNIDGRDRREIYNFSNISSVNITAEAIFLAGLNLVSYNTTFNQTLTDLLYYSISNPRGFYESDANITSLNASKVANFDINCPSGYYESGVNASNESIACVLNRGNSTFNQSLTDSLYFSNITDFTGTLNNQQMCRYDSGNTEIDCDQPNRFAMGVTASKWCQVDVSGSYLECDKDITQDNTTWDEDRANGLYLQQRNGNITTFIDAFNIPYIKLNSTGDPSAGAYINYHVKPDGVVWTLGVLSSDRFVLSNGVITALHIVNESVILNYSAGDSPYRPGLSFLINGDTNATSGHDICLDDDSDCLSTALKDTGDTATGEYNFTAISADGANKVVCIKSDGNLGTCSAIAVNASGLCPCS